jgi:hypothetical protein
MAPQTLSAARDVHNPQDARGGGNIASADAHHHEGNIDLVKWLVMIAILSGLSLGMSIMTMVFSNQSEYRTRTELDRQFRFIQEYRIRVEDAEIAAEEVNPKFHPRRTE